MSLSHQCFDAPMLLQPKIMGVKEGGQDFAFSVLICLFWGHFQAWKAGRYVKIYVFELGSHGKAKHHGFQAGTNAWKPKKLEMETKPTALSKTDEKWE